MSLEQVLPPKLLAQQVIYSVSELQTRTLLTYVDFLFIFQRTLEEQLVTACHQTGCIPIIVGAHHIFGLSVLLRSRITDVRSSTPKALYVHHRVTSNTKTGERNLRVHDEDGFYLDTRCKGKQVQIDMD